jgi:hypothetical protein
VCAALVQARVADTEAKGIALRESHLISVQQGKLASLRSKLWTLCFSLLLINLSGCTSIGPSTVNRDRFDYVVAISESVKRQTLLNMVKARYLDMPVYMDIASVISQYALESQLGFEWHLRSN